MTLDLDGFRAFWSIVMFALVVGIGWWAFRPANRRRFEHDATMIFEDKDAPGPGPGRRA